MTQKAVINEAERCVSDTDILLVYDVFKTLIEDTI